MNNLIESLQVRKEYIENHYNFNDKVIALFEVETLLKIINKHSGEKPVIKKPKRVRGNKKNKGFFN